MMKTNHKRRALLAALGCSAAGVMLGGIAQASERVIKVTAKRFVFTPGELQLERGKPVVLELTSLDVPMGFSLPALGVRTDVMPGAISRLRLVPDQAGRFDFVCDVFCGSGHEGMSGVMIVS